MIIFFVSTLAIVFIIPNVAFAKQNLKTEEFDYDNAYNWALEVGSLKDNKETRGNISTSDMNFRASTAKNISNGKITSVNVYFTAAWINGRPYSRLTDAIISNWDSGKWHFKDGSFWGRIEEVHNNGGVTSTVYSASVAARQEQGGLGWFAPLGKTVLGYTPTVRIGYQLVPKQTNMSDGTAYSSSITSTYGHQHIDFSTINLTSSGVTVSMNGQNDDMGITTSVKHG